MLRIDAHHHVWRLDRGDYGWIKPNQSIHRDYGLDDLRPLLGDITATVLVHAAGTDAETEYLLDVAQGSQGLVRGVVGWADLAASEAASRITALARNPPLKGLQPILRDIPDTYWILREEIKPALRAMAEAGLCLDAQIEPRHLPLIPVLRMLNPTLKIVIDHAAAPPIAAGAFQPWADDLKRAANETDVFCKLSGLTGQAGPNWMMNHLRRWVDHVFDCFGPSRVMWGSDWPIINLTGDYQRWHTMTERFLFRYVPADREQIMGGTAARFYGLT